MATCGSTTRTCGGMTSSGPGDSDWYPCDTHAGDYPYFGVIYAAQVDAMFNLREVPATREACQAYAARYLVDGKVADGVVRIVELS